MKLSTLKDHSRDGRLLVVSRDLAWAVEASDIAATLQEAIEHWPCVETALRMRYDALNEGTRPGPSPLIRSKPPHPCLVPGSGWMRRPSSVMASVCRRRSRWTRSKVLNTRR